MQLKKGQILTVNIDKLGFGGAGIGAIDKQSLNDESLVNYKIFVEDSIPGDVVEASLTKIKKNYAEASLEQIIQLSPLRIEAACKHFDQCGGCKWQFLAYDKQLEFKEQHVHETLERIGGFDNLNLLPIIACAEPWYYRNKMEFSFGDTVDRQFALGLHIPKRRHDLVDIDECLLQSELSNQILAAVRGFVLSHNLGFFRYLDNAGLLRNLVIREAKSSGQVMVNLLISHEVFPANLIDELIELLHGIDQKICSLYLTQIISKRGQPKQILEKLIWGKEVILENLNVLNKSFVFQISPQAFFQPNPKQAEVLYTRALEMADIQAGDIAYDLYCGTGTIGVIMSKFCAQVYGLELNESAVANAKTNANLNNSKNIEFLCGDAGVIIPEIPKQPDLIVVDPPRAGLSPKALGHILTISKSSAQNSRDLKLVYISCNPASQARDLKILCESGFVLEAVQPVDMFPHTYHIECIAKLSFIK